MPPAPEIKHEVEVDYDRIIQSVLGQLPAPSPGVAGDRGEPGPPGPPGEVDSQAIIRQILEKLPPPVPGKDADEDEIVRRVTQNVLRNIKRRGSFTITVPAP